MRKLRTLLISISALALASSCSQEDIQNGVNGENTYKGFVSEGATRSYNGGDGAFKWSNGDDVAAYTSTGFQTLTFKSGAGTNVATYESSTIVAKDVAVFPVSAAKSYTDGKLTVNYPSVIALNSDVDDPLVAYVSAGQTDLNFKHVGGVINYDLTLPAGVNTLEVTMDKAIAGDFEVTNSDGAPVATTTADNAGSKTVKFTFTATTAPGVTHFQLPVPTGTYNSMTLTAISKDGAVKTVTNTATNTVNRCDWLTFEINMCDYAGSIEQVVNGAEALNDLIANTAADELAKKNLTIDLQNETYTYTGTEDKKITSLNVAGLTLQNGTISATGLNIKSSGAVTLKNINFVGDFPKSNTNARVSINTPAEVVVDGVDFTNATKGYNDLEINLNSRPVSDKVTIKNCKFGKGNVNNNISIFGMPEGGVINIENCDFTLSSTSEAVRISNKLDSHQFTINVKDCNYNYPDGFRANSLAYVGFFIFEDHTSKAPDTAKQFSGLKVNCENVTYNGTKVQEVGVGTRTVGKQFACMCYDHGTLSVTDESHFPTFTFK